MPAPDPNKIDFDFSPFFAGQLGKTEEERVALLERVDQLPEALRNFVFSDIPEVALRKLTETESLGSNYGPAIAKIVLLALLGDVPLTSITELLERLGVPSSSADRISKGITELVRPIVAAKTQSVVETKPLEIPPMTRTVGGIIDLRKPPTV